MSHDRSLELPAAQPDDPPLGVHVLTEFIFCQRAGLLTWEQRESDSGDDRDPHLNYLPDYFVREITEALEEVTQRVWCFLTWAPVAMSVIGIVGWSVSWILAACLAIGAATTLPIFWRDVSAMWKLNERRNLARQPGGAEPRLDLSSPQEVNWWAMQQAGFEPIRLNGELNDPRTRLSGKPWAILQRADTRIPVFLRRSSDRRLFPQHFARIAAYCHLIATCERARAPYGIILFADTYDGIAIPVDESSGQELERGLELARRLIRSKRERRADPGPAQDANPCIDCPLGRPRDYHQGETELVIDEITLAAHVTNDINGKPCVSDCGTRYRWVPTHREAIARRLTD